MVQPASYDCVAGVVPLVTPGALVATLWDKGASRGAGRGGGENVLTHKVCKQDDQGSGEDEGAQGGTLPVAILGGLLEVKGRSGEGAAGQGPGWGRVHGARREGVPWGCGAEERGGASWLEEEVPVDGERREGVSICLPTRRPGQPAG